MTGQLQLIAVFALEINHSPMDKCSEWSAEDFSAVTFLCKTLESVCDRSFA